MHILRELPVKAGKTDVSGLMGNLLYGKLTGTEQVAGLLDAVLLNKFKGTDPHNCGE